MPKACPECGARADDHHRFCGRCGTSLEGVATSGAAPHAYCTSCGAPFTERDRYCARCGAPARSGGATRDDGGEIEGERFDPDDFFREWEADPLRPDEARTEQVRVVPAGKTDTAVLPVISTETTPATATSGPAGEARERFPWGAAFAFGGAVAVVASSALPLASAGRTILPRDVSISALLFPEGPARGPSLGLVLLALGVIAALVALVTMLVPRLRILRRVAGALTLVVPVLVVVQIVSSGTAVAELPSVAGVGLYLAVAGAATQLVAGRRLRR